MSGNQILNCRIIFGQRSCLICFNGSYASGVYNLYNHGPLHVQPKRWNYSCQLYKTNIIVTYNFAFRRKHFVGNFSACIITNTDFTKIDNPRL